MELLSDMVQLLNRDLFMSDLTPAKPHPNPHRRALTEELASLIDLDIEIMVRRLGAKTDLFDIDLLLSLARLALLFVALVDVLAIVYQAAHRRLRLRGHLDQVVSSLLGDPQGFTGGKDPKLLSRLVDQPDLSDADLVVDAVLSATDVSSSAILLVRRQDKSPRPAE